ncbi:hypothetical protein GCM10022221_37720 [Actinocorallia aurea]
MVGAEERPETEALCLLGDREEVAVGGAFLGLGEDAEFHGGNLPVWYRHGCQFVSVYDLNSVIVHAKIIPPVN